MGRYPLEGTFTFEKHLTVTPTGAELVSKCPNSLACSGCFKQKDKNTTEAERYENKLNMLNMIKKIMQNVI